MTASLWDSTRLCDALKNEKWCDPRLVELFRQHDVDAEVMLELTWEELNQVFGITQFGQAKKLIRSFKLFASENNISVAPVQQRSLPPTPEPKSKVPMPETRPQSREVAVEFSRTPSPALYHKKPVMSSTEEPARALTPNGKPPLSHQATTPDASLVDTTLGPLADTSLDISPVGPTSSKPDIPTVVEENSSTFSALVTAAQQEPPQEPAYAPPTFMTLGAVKKANERPYEPGILEQERRFIVLKELFRSWDDISTQEGTAPRGFIPFDEVRGIVVEVFPWGSDALLVESNFVSPIVRAMQGVSVQKDGIKFKPFAQVFMDLFHPMEPWKCDACIGKIKTVVGAKRKAAERLRRRKLISDLFHRWDVDNHGIVTGQEFMEMLTQYNVSCGKDGKEHVAVTPLTGMTAVEYYAIGEFVDFIHTRTERFEEDDFDVAMYKLLRCVEDRVEAEGKVVGTDGSLDGVPLTALHELYQKSTCFTPIVVYGRDIDPSKSIEAYTRKLGFQIHSLLVTNEKAEKQAAKELVRWGCGKGHWIYVTTTEGGWESVVRLLAVTLQSQNGWMVHRKFRLWIHVAMDYFNKLPEVMLSTECLPCDLTKVQSKQGK